MAHAQTVNTRPSLEEERPGIEASLMSTPTTIYGTPHGGPGGGAAQPLYCLAGMIFTCASNTCARLVSISSLFAIFLMVLILMVAADTYTGGMVAADTGGMVGTETDNGMGGVGGSCITLLLFGGGG